MCNHYKADAAWRERTGEFSQLKIPLFDSARARPNVEGPDIWPGYTAEILAVEDGVTVAEAAMWLFVPFWFKGELKAWRKERGGCNNAKGETAATSGIFKSGRRCLIPGEAFYEYAAAADPATGKKPEHRFTPADGRPFFFAGLKTRAEPADGPLTTFTMVTKGPGPDVLSIGHKRQPVVLPDDQLAAWLDPARPIADFLEPSPAGTFTVERAR